MYSETEQNQKNMKECDKRNSHISSKLYMNFRSSNNDRHCVTKTFSPLHPTSPNYTSLHLTLHFFLFKLYPTILHYPLIWLNLFKFLTVPFHLTSSYVLVLSRNSRGKHWPRNYVLRSNPYQGTEVTRNITHSYAFHF
jgi:hypothetical protein